MRIIGVGDNTVDVYLHQNLMYPGGNAVNVAVLCHRAGAAEAAYLGILGDDAAGRLLYASLREEGLDLSHVRTVHGQNSKNAIALNAQNDRTWVGNNRDGACGRVQLLFDEPDIDYICGFDVLHTSVHSKIPDLLDRVQGRLMVSMDFSDGYNDERIARLCSYLDVAFFSGSGRSTAENERTIGQALDAGAKCVVMTMGTEGSVATDGRTRVFQPALESPVPVVDTLGAGDTYIAAFLLHYYNTRDLRQAAAAGAEFALTALTGSGAFGHPAPADRSGLLLNE